MSGDIKKLFMIEMLPVIVFVILSTLSVFIIINMLIQIKRLLNNED
jgi:hypothetical protein